MGDGLYFKVQIPNQCAHKAHGFHIRRELILVYDVDRGPVIIKNLVQKSQTPCLTQLSCLCFIVQNPQVQNKFEFFYLLYDKL